MFIGLYSSEQSTVTYRYICSKHRNERMQTSQFIQSEHVACLLQHEPHAWLWNFSEKETNDTLLGQPNFWPKNLKNLDFILTCQFPAFAIEMWNTKHISEIKPIDWKSFFCCNETKIRSVKDPIQEEVKNCGWKSIQNHKRNIQCQNLLEPLKCYHA